MFIPLSFEPDETPNYSINGREYGFHDQYTHVFIKEQHNTATHVCHLNSSGRSEKFCQMEMLLVEIGGVSIIFGAVFAVTKLYSISDIDKRLSKDTNQAIFCIIPVVVYVLFRLYFKLLFYITSFGKFSAIRPIACKSILSRR